MRISILLFWLLCLLPAGCKILYPTSTHTTKQDSPFLSITPVFSIGASPLMSLWINKEGNAEYIRHNYTQNLGFYTKKLSAEEMNFVNSLMVKEMGGESKIDERGVGNEEVQPCTISWYDGTAQKSMRSKRAIHLYKIIKQTIGLDSLHGWEYLNGMGKTSLTIKKIQKDSSYLQVYYSSMGNVLNISTYDKNGKRFSLRFQHNLSARRVYHFFEIMDKYIREEKQAHLTQEDIYIMTGELEINPL